MELQLHPDSAWKRSSGVSHCTFGTGKFHAGFWWPLPNRVRMELQLHPDSAWKRSSGVFHCTFGTGKFHAGFWWPLPNRVRMELLRYTNYANLLCYKTLHDSGIFFAPHQAFSTVHSALVSFMQDFDDRFQTESGWNCRASSSIMTLLGSGHQNPAWNLPVPPNIQWKTPDDGQRRCPKHVEFYNRINLDN